MNSIRDSFHPICWDLYKTIKNGLKLAGTILLTTAFLFSLSLSQPLRESHFHLMSPAAKKAENIIQETIGNAVEKLSPEDYEAVIESIHSHTQSLLDCIEEERAE